MLQRLRISTYPGGDRGSALRVLQSVIRSEPDACGAGRDQQPSAMRAFSGRSCKRLVLLANAWAAPALLDQGGGRER